MKNLHLLSSYRYDLPEELIARHPLEKRDACKLLVLNRQQESIEHAHFQDLPDILNSSFHLVLNDSKVLPARLFAKKDTGGKVEILLTEELDEKDHWKALVKPAKKIRQGMVLQISDALSAQVIEKEEQQFIIKLIGKDVFSSLLQEGSMPLPPYIKREAEQIDSDNYQTVYANRFGSIAAPTAGLHFTDRLLQKLSEKNIDQSLLTLHVGLGTFFPVKTENILEHKMHKERLWVSQSAAEKLNRLKKEGKKILPVGTTSLRALETAYDSNSGIQSGSFVSDLFIYPGYQFRVPDALITNFHLPESTLLMLVSAFAGYDFIFSAYREAIAKKYRFFSYGDAMLIL